MFKKRKKQKRIYLDSAAATYTDPRVEEKMRKFWQEVFGNPGSLHAEGVAAKKALLTFQAHTGSFLNAHADEVVYTASATEANNIAIQGIVRAHNKPLSQCHAITSAIEHPSVRDVFRALEKEGLAVSYIGVDERGVLDVEAIKNALRPDTIVVSVMHGNNEIGTIQPIEEIAKAIRAHRKHNACSTPFFHTDACQTAGYILLDVEKLGVDALVINGSKIYGPKGVGVLYVRRNTPVVPIMYGGAQGGGLRPGTENMPAIAGLSEALTLVEEKREEEYKRLAELRDFFVEEIAQRFSGAVINSRGAILPHIVNVSFPGIDNEHLIIELDAKGIAVSSTSACKAQDESVSYVIQALGPDHYPESAIRIGMGRDTTHNNLEYVLDTLQKTVQKLKTNI